MTKIDLKEWGSMAGDGRRRTGTHEENMGEQWWFSCCSVVWQIVWEAQEYCSTGRNSKKQKEFKRHKQEIINESIASRCCNEPGARR